MKFNRRHPLQAMRTLALPRAERAAARSERRAEAQMRLERDNVESADRRAAAIRAEANRYGGGDWGGYP
jgi:hypothetical protein